MTATSDMPDSPSTSAGFRVQGCYIPAIGLGTFQGDVGNGQVKQSVATALRQGYRHIDTAAAYGNEKEVGEGIRESGVPRHEIFVTTKLAQTWHDPADVEEALHRSLDDLRLDYVDLYLMHFPHAYAATTDHSTLRQPNGKPQIDLKLSQSYPATWASMEKLVEKGKTKLIGLSNFNVLKTKRILMTAKIRPAVNQVELHPYELPRYLPQHELFEFCTQEDIHLMAHQPLGGRPVAVVNPNANHPGPLEDPTLRSIATEYEKSPAQVLLSWAVQRGTSAVPKTVRESRLEENRRLFTLNDTAMDAINQLAEERGRVRFLNPRNHIGFDIFDESHDQPTMGDDQ